MRAASSGSEAVSQAHGQLMGQYRAGAENANQMAQIAGGAASKAAEMTQQEAHFSRGLEQRQSETNLEAAKAGFEPDTPKGKGGRAEQLDAEMEKGQQQPGQIGPIDPESQKRLSDTTKEPLEMDGQGRWRPTAERKANTERTQKREDFQADTDRIKAITYRDQVGVSAQKAFIADDMEAFEENAKLESSHANDRQNQFDRLVKNGADVHDWDSLSKMTAELSAFEPTAAADIAAKKFTPRLAASIKAMIGKEALSAIARTGTTKFLDIDMTNPKMIEFSNWREQISLYYAANPAMVPSFVNSTQRKMFYINQQAAAQVLMGISQAPRGQGSGDSIPAMDPNAPPGEGAGPAAPPLQHSQQDPRKQKAVEAIQGTRIGGGGSQEALQRGQQVDPTGYRDQPGQVHKLSGRFR